MVLDLVFGLGLDWLSLGVGLGVGVGSLGVVMLVLVLVWVLLGVGVGVGHLGVGVGVGVGSAGGQCESRVAGDGVALPIIEVAGGLFNLFKSSRKVGTIFAICELTAR